MIRDILIKSNEETTHYVNETLAFEEDCKRKLKSDIAVVIVSIDSPTFTRTAQTIRVSSFDKLAIIGKTRFRC